MGALHSSSIGGHSGQRMSWHRISSIFYWPELKQDVKKFVQTCDTCQRNKAEHIQYPGLLQPLPIPSQAWIHISMDFIEKLPLSQNFDTILVVVDRLTKYSHFLLLVHPFLARQVAQVFIDQVYKLHGLPETIVTDRDKIFTSHFWRKLFRLVGVKLCYSSAYHPETDGQTERVNQCVEAYLRCMTGEFPS